MTLQAKPHKVFCIGFMKTGTTTLNRALSILGYRVSHNSWRWLKYIFRNDWQSIKDKMNEWDAAEDNPIPLIYKELDQLFPGSKFILTTRDPEKWYDSVSYHIGNLKTPMHEWLFGRGKGLPKQDKEHSIRIFNTHRERVIEYFKDRPEDLLIIDVTEIQNWNTICSFLDEEIPSTPFPHANKTNYKNDKHAGIKHGIRYWKKRIINPTKICWFNHKTYLPSPNQRLERL
ncbi:MAG: sulfotransferase family protein [Salibacteraceae bacterium]